MFDSRAITDTKNWLKKTWGLQGEFALKIAYFLYDLYNAGLSPRVTSGYRSTSYQQELARRYDRGDRSIVYKPAAKSLHSNRDFFGPASLAVDISNSNHYRASQIARQRGVKSGFTFGDGVHFYT